MGRKEHTSGNVWATLNGWLKWCVKRTSGCVVTAILCQLILLAYPFPVFGKTYVPIFQLYDGQCYGDAVHYKVIGSSSQYYDLITEKEFLEKLGSKGFFLYRWAYNQKLTKEYFTLDENTLIGSPEKSQTTMAIEAAGLSVFSSNTNVDDSAILKLFPSSEVIYGFVLGVVDKNCTQAYDMTSRINEYTKKGSRTDYDGIYYETTSGDVTGSSVVRLTNLGAQAFYEDLMAGQKYITAKDKEVKDTTPTLPDTALTNATETASFTNIVITTYYTNITIIVDPYFQNLNSILKFKYPKYATEGNWIVYELERLGVQYDPLTVHLITNGHWCANVSWAAKEGGTKKVRVKIPVSDEFNDNAPLEVLVKTLNRRVESE